MYTIFKGIASLTLLRGNNKYNIEYDYEVKITLNNTVYTKRLS